MQFPKLTPLQSRFAATFAATILLLVLYYAFFTNSGSFAYALEIREIALPTIVDDYPLLIEGRKPEEIVGRDTSGLTSLGNNQGKLSNINFGETQNWVFPKETVNGPKSSPPKGLPANLTAPSSSTTTGVVPNHELKKRASTVYISLNTCIKPEVNSTNPASSSASLPPLTVYISTSDNNQKPGPGQNADEQTEYTADQGYMAATIQASGDVYIGVSAPNTTDFYGIYNYELGSSVDASYHSYEDSTNLYFVDSDIHSALLITDNLTQSAPTSPNYHEWMDMQPPFTIFANNINNSAIYGLERSYCALNQWSQIRKGNNAINTSMTSRGLGNEPKEQFYFTYLNSSSTYYGILGMDGNSTSSGNGVISGGGKVWRAMNFTTKAGMFEIHFLVSYMLTSLCR